MPSSVINNGTTVLPLDYRLTGQTITLGGTTTLGFAGDAAISGLAPSLDGGSEIETLLLGQAAAENALLQASGRFVNRGTIAANAVHGAMTIKAQPLRESARAVHQCGRDRRARRQQPDHHRPTRGDVSQCRANPGERRHHPRRRRHFRRRPAQPRQRRHDRARRQCDISRVPGPRGRSAAARPPGRVQRHRFQLRRRRHDRSRSLSRPRPDLRL